MAKSCADESPGFEADLSKFLQRQCFLTTVNLPLVFRGLEILAEIVEGRKAIVILRPFLNSNDPQIASKAVLVLGRRCHDVGWMKKVMAEVDDRVRANLVESLWRRHDPEIELVLKAAVKDPHHRVAANAVYGLFLLGSPLYSGGIDRLMSRGTSDHLTSAIWVIREVGGPDAAARIKPLIRHVVPGIRRAAFEALVYLREQSSEAQQEAEPAMAG